MRTRSLHGAVVLALLSSFAAHAGQDVSYESHIKPLLTHKCYSCHGALRQEAGLRLETRQLMIEGGDSGGVIVPGDAAVSLLIERVTGDEDSRMPPAEEGAALKPDEIELLTKWIAAGAPAPEEATPPAPTEHWAFQPIHKPALESTHRHPLDALLEKKREATGLIPQPAAARSIAIRRLYLDLIGLPPTLSQLSDDRPWNEIVDELLASPHHGERWGRHWMDVWRYSDWYGLGAQLRYSQKHMWHWRDWIVNSLNQDKPYDRMIHEMLGGDELEPNNPDVVAGTGFLARNYYLFNRTTWLDSTIEHTGKAFLGLTLNCAKCHDHKYDPISQVDYYSFRAIFEPHQVRLDPVPGETNLERDGLPRVFDDQPDAKTWLHVRGNPKDPDRDTEIRPRVPAIFAAFEPEIVPVRLPAEAYAPSVRDYVRTDQLAVAVAARSTAAKELAAARQRARSASQGTPNPQDAQQPFALSDDFDAPRPDTWELTGPWKYAAGRLLRETSTREPESIRLKQPLPRDFEVTCTYTTTGGETYKSVTFRFDESDDQRYANYVYTSAHAPGPKVQIAFTRDGRSTYPADGRVAKPIRVGQSYKLRFAVRDRLVNVWLDDAFLLAWQLPDRRPGGSFSMTGFDATVAFEHIHIRSLPKDVKLTPAKNSTATSPAELAQLVKVQQAKLDWRTAAVEAVEAVIAADRARYVTGDAADSLIETAARRQADALAKQAEYELLAANGDGKKTAAAKARAAQAKKRLEAIAAGKPSYTGVRASRKALEGPDHKEADYPPVYTQTSTGRRLALAKWVTAPENPLTARVAVNHVWLRHFGKPLVESVFDFGLRAKRPLHADVLDYLAAEFMESGWSFRHLHRLIVTSEAYRMTSSSAGASGGTIAADPDNHFYWRMPSQRMDAQTVRDSLLLLAGELDRTLGGPSVDVGVTSRRRSLYFKHSRDDQDKFLSMFDNADLLQCYRRSESIVPQQALALANGELSMRMAEAIANRIAESSTGGDRVFAAAAFRCLLARDADEDELSACLLFCDQLRKLPEYAGQSPAAAAAQVRVRLVHSLLNHNDFVSIR